MSQDIKCPCCEDKTVAKTEDGKIFVWCKKCKKEVELNFLMAVKEFLQSYPQSKENDDLIV